MSRRTKDAASAALAQWNAKTRWVAPPTWPQPPEGWQPAPGWQPNPAWGPAPANWQFWQTPDPAPEQEPVEQYFYEEPIEAPAEEYKIPTVWSNVFTLRFWHMVIWVPFLIALLPYLVFAPLGIIVHVVAVIFVFRIGLVSPLVCPHCQKRVKPDADVCRWCGWEI